MMTKSLVERIIPVNAGCVCMYVFMYSNTFYIQDESFFQSKLTNKSIP